MAKSCQALLFAFFDRSVLIINYSLYRNGFLYLPGQNEDDLNKVLI